MDIQAEYRKAQQGYEKAAAEMEAARLNSDRLSTDPAKKKAADDAFAAKRRAAQLAYEAVDDLEKVAKRQAERAAARAAVTKTADA